MPWFRKLAAIVLLSLGVALIYLPFPASLAGERIEEVVRLQVQPAPFTEESARERFGSGFMKLSYEGMDEFPEVREAILGLMGHSGSRCVPFGEWQSLLADRSIVDPEGVAYAFRDGLYRVSKAEARDFGPEGLLVCLEVTMLGAYDNSDWGPMVRLDPGDLDGYPELRSEIEHLAVGPVPAEGSQDISWRQWRRFQRREVDDRGYGPDFVVFDRLYSGVVEAELVSWTLQTSWLRQTAAAVGAGAALFGILMAMAAYRGASARPGIPVSSPWLAVFCDVISLVGGAFFIVLAIDTLWVGPIGQSSLLGLHPEWPSSQPITGLHFVSVPAVFVALPLLTLWFTSLSAQRIEVDGERVTSHGALGSMSIPWQDLERVELCEQKNPFSFTVVDFRGLQKVLELEGADCSVTINEPSSRERKGRILNALILHAPEDKKTLIRGIEMEW